MVLSPSVLVILISPLADKLKALSPRITLHLYVDDLLIIITGPLALVGPVLCQAIYCLQSFSAHRGLHVNTDKSAILLKGD